jgi:hypothetical protein
MTKLSLEAQFTLRAHEQMLTEVSLCDLKLLYLSLLRLHLTHKQTAKDLLKQQLLGDLRHDRPQEN